MFMDYKDDVQAQNLTLYGYHDTGFRFEKSGLKKKPLKEEQE